MKSFIGFWCWLINYFSLLFRSETVTAFEFIELKVVWDIWFFKSIHILFNLPVLYYPFIWQCLYIVLALEISLSSIEYNLGELLIKAPHSLLATGRESDVLSLKDSFWVLTESTPGLRVVGAILSCWQYSEDHAH